MESTSIWPAITDNILSIIASILAIVVGAPSAYFLIKKTMKKFSDKTLKGLSEKNARGSKKIVLIISMTLIALTISISLIVGNIGREPTENLSVGDVIQFGNINWVVIHIEGNEALLLSRKILENRKYHFDSVLVSWEDSDLREYLNGVFYAANFNVEDEARIIEKESLTVDYIYGKLYEGNKTMDKVFVLSLYEYNTYVLENAFSDFRYSFADKSSFWWLRSTGDVQYHVACLNNNSSLKLDDDDNILDPIGVRPAVWIKIE